MKAVEQSEPAGPNTMAKSKATEADSIEQLDNPFDQVLGYQVRRASGAIMASLNRELEPLNLSVSEVTLLTLISTNPGCTQSDIGRALGIQRTNIVPIIKGLMLAGSLKREPSTGRALSLFLTPQGKTRVGEIQQAITRHEQRITQHIPEDQQQQVMAVLKLIGENALGD